MLSSYSHTVRTTADESSCKRLLTALALIVCTTIKGMCCIMGQQTQCRLERISFNETNEDVRMYT